MMMELITKIIILATAVVGLYKASTFHRGKPTQVRQEGQKKASSFSDFFELIGVFLFMLAFPAFLYAFMWIMSSLPNAISSSSNTNEFPIIEISKNSPISEVMLTAALNITNSYTRDKQLQSIIKFAISNKDYVTALKAAASISSSVKKDQELEKIIKAVSSEETPNSNEKAPNNKTHPTPKSGAAD